MPVPLSDLSPRLRAGLVWTVLLLAVAWFYAWTPASFPRLWVGARPDGFYAEMGDAFLRGHLHLLRRPDPQLTRLPDPYDPARNAAWRVDNLSYYHGRYYLYHSAVPVLVLYVPVKLLTGRYLSDDGATLFLALVGFAAALAVLLTVRRRWLAGGPWLVVLGAAGVLALGSGYQAVLRQASINQVAIASGYCFLMLALLALLRALLAERRPAIWLALASLAFGLAIASRPDYVFAGLALAVPAWALNRRHGFRWTHLLAAGLPAAAVIAALLAYNWLRFDRPLEFGARYMLGAWDQRAMGGLSLHFARVNAWHYLFSRPDLHADFPFVTAPSWLATGVLVQTPFLWLALLAALAWRRRDGDAGAGPNLRAFIVVLLVVLAANLGVLLLLPSGNPEAVLASANARYVLDFQPAFALLAGLGALTAGQLAAPRAWWRRSLAAGATVLALASMLAGLSLDFQRLPADSYRPLARWLDAPHHAWQWFKADTYGPVRLELKFPANRPGAYEPLVATGTYEAGDLLYVHYDRPGSIRFGLVGIGMPGPVSDPIPVDFAAPHRVDVYLGSLYPPADSPACAGWSEAQLDFAERHVRVALDGRTVFTARAHFYPASPRDVDLGHTAILRDYCAARFSGEITASGRLAVTPPELPRSAAPVYGAVRLTVRFPKGKNYAVEPLLVTGVQQAGDLLSAQYVDDERLRLTLDHWGHPSRRSRWLRIDFSTDHVLEVWMGSLFPPLSEVAGTGFSAAQVEPWKHHVRVLLDGLVVLDVDQDTYDSAPGDVTVGKNAIGGSSCGYAFTGEVRDAQRLPPGEAAPEP